MIEFTIPHITDNITSLILRTILATLSCAIALLGMLAGAFVSAIIWTTVSAIWTIGVVIIYRDIKKDISKITGEYYLNTSKCEEEKDNTDVCLICRKPVNKFVNQETIVYQVMNAKDYYHKECYEKIYGKHEGENIIT